MNRTALIALSFLIFRLSSQAASSAALQDRKDQTVPPQSHEIVVTATRIETPIREIAGAVTVITRQDLEKTTRTNLLEVIQDGLGVAAVRNGGPGAASSVFLRGANSEHILVLLDGIALNDPMNPSRSFDLAHLSLDNIERIEVLRGPQSTLYGSDALAGVVNILSRRGAGRPVVSLETSGGSYGTYRNSAVLGGSAGALSYSLGLSLSRAQGFSAAASSYAGNTEADGYRNSTASGNFSLALSPVAEAGLTIRAVDAQTDLDGFGGPGGDDPNSRQDYRSLFVSLGGRTLLLAGRWEMKGSLSVLRSGRDHDNPTDPLHPFDSERGRFRSGLLKLDWQNNFFFHPSHTLTLGAEIQREQGQSDYLSESAWGPSASDFPSRRVDRVGVYLQDQIRLGGRFFAAAGARADVHGRTGAAFTYRFAPAYVVEKTGTRFKATLGTGFKSPSLYQLYAPGTFWGPIGNTALHSERSLGWDAGLEQSLFGGRLLAGATYFRNDFRDLIDFDFSRGYVNIGRARTEGLETFASLQPSTALDLRFSYTRMTATDLDDDAPLLRRPRDKASAEARWRPARALEIRAFGSFVGNRPDRDYVAWPYPLATLHSYVLLDADVSFDVGPKTRIFLRLDNLFDERYETVFGYGTPRLSAYVGIKLKVGSPAAD